MSQILTRRTVLTGAIASGGALLSGCDALSQNQTFLGLLGQVEHANFAIQRSLTDRMALAKEFRPDQRSPIFRANGTRVPSGDAYAAHMATQFANWRVRVDGLVAKPLSLSIADIRSMPTRTQITRHDCVEGWSAIGKWHGVPLSMVLDAAAVRTSAHYIVFHCADNYGGPAGKLYYESIDMIDARHPQTILAWGLNDAILPVGNGAPLRLRVERQLGYKHAKYVERIEAVASLEGIHGGKGGFWEDDHGYQWYAGI